jgi:YegS/Rv2252/BmrU family lipid kinase
MVMRALILYNPKAGRGTSAKLAKEAVTLFREHGITLEPRPLQLGVNPFEDALDTELAVVCGGDGSINYVVNCMRSLGINPTLGIVPMGTANDLANALDIPHNSNMALRRILEGKEHHIDCCKVNDRYFVNILSFGIFTTASQRTPRNAKQQFGILAYIKPGIDDVKDMRSIKVNIKTDKEEYEGNIYMFLAFNGITAGRIPLTRDSHVDDGVMDVIVLEKRNKLLSFSNMLRYVLGGNPEAVRHFRCSEMVVTTNQHCITDVDGERGPNFPLHIICEPRSLKIRM